MALFGEYIPQIWHFAAAGIDKATAEKYVTLLEQAYVVFRLGSYSRNLRNELKRATKIYFYEVGIRNALLGDFSPPATRSDIGHLFENLVLAEFAKHRSTLSLEPLGYFWRVSGGREIDFVTGSEWALHAYETKWNPNARASFPKAFLNAYAPASTTVIHRTIRCRYCWVLAPKLTRCIALVYLGW
jgi:predicted AAA+ superfamily ATPase